MHPIGQLTHISRSDGAPDPDGTLGIGQDRPDPITFLPLAVDTSDRLYDDFIRLIFLDDHRETSTLTKDFGDFRRNRISFDSFTLLVYLI